MLLHPNSQSCIRHRRRLAGSLGSCFSHPLSRALPRQTDRYNPCSLGRAHRSLLEFPDAFFFQIFFLFLFLLHSAHLQYPEWFLFLIVMWRISTKIHRSSLRSKYLARNSLLNIEAKEKQATSLTPPPSAPSSWLRYPVILSWCSTWWVRVRGPCCLFPESQTCRKPLSAQDP